MKLESTVVLAAGVAVSVLLHAVVIVAWLRQPVVTPVALGAPTVTVDLLAPASPPASEPQAQPDKGVRLAPHKVVKKKQLIQQEAVKKTQQDDKPPLPPVVSAAPTTAPPSAVQTAMAAQVTAARFEANYLSAPAVYPPLSQRLGEEGRVLLRVEVSVDGRPLHIALKTSSGFERLDQAAIKAVARWQFKPAQQNGSAVASTVDVPVRFKLKKRNEDRQ
jgi:protein TonB